MEFPELIVLEMKDGTKIELQGDSEYWCEWLYGWHLTSEHIVLFIKHDTWESEINIWNSQEISQLEMPKFFSMIYKMEKYVPEILDILNKGIDKL